MVRTISMSLGFVVLTGCTAPSRVSLAEVQYMLRTEVPLRQELYRAQHGTYAADWRDLGLIGGGSASGPSGFIRVMIHDATADGWSASTSDRRGDGPVCVMYHGRVNAFPMAPNSVIPGQPDAIECVASIRKARAGST